MKRIYRLKKSADNEFTASFGIEAFQMKGGSNCLIVKKTLYYGMPVQRVAYCETINFIQGRAVAALKVTPTCGVLNCVSRDHLVATYEPTKKDHQYIIDNINTLGISFLAHAFKIPLPVFEEYMAKPALQTSQKPGL